MKPRFILRATKKDDIVFSDIYTDEDLIKAIGDLRGHSFEVYSLSDLTIDVDANSCIIINKADYNVGNNIS